MTQDPAKAVEAAITDFMAHVGLDEDCGLLESRTLNVDDVEVGLVLDEDDPETDTLHLVCELGSPEGGASAALMKRMLEANIFGLGTGGAALSLNPETGAAYLTRGLLIGGLSGPVLAAAIEALVAAAQDWRQAIAEVGADQRLDGGGQHRPR